MLKILNYFSNNSSNYWNRLNINVSNSRYKQSWYFCVIVDDDPMDTQEPVMMYYVNDGVYGSFNCLLFDHAKVEVSTLQVMKTDFTNSLIKK